MDWIQLAVLGIQLIALGLTYWMLEIMSGFIKDFGHKTGLDKVKHD